MTTGKPAPSAATPPGGQPWSVSVRPATHEDVAAMAAIEQHAFTDPWSAEAFSELLGRPHVSANVAVDAGGSIVGYCVLLRVLDEAEVANLAVHREARGHGIGARLLDEAMQRARESQVATVYLEVRVSNNAARALYESRGFQPVGRRRAYYRQPLEDALVLRWVRADGPASQ